MAFEASRFGHIAGDQPPRPCGVQYSFDPSPDSSRRLGLSQPDRLEDCQYVIGRDLIQRLVGKRRSVIAQAITSLLPVRRVLPAILDAGDIVLSKLSEGFNRHRFNCLLSGKHGAGIIAQHHGLPHVCCQGPCRCQSHRRCSPQADLNPLAANRRHEHPGSRAAGVTRRYSPPPSECLPGSLSAAAALTVNMLIARAIWYHALNAMPTLMPTFNLA